MTNYVQYYYQRSKLAFKIVMSLVAGITTAAAFFEKIPSTLFFLEEYHWEVHGLFWLILVILFYPNKKELLQKDTKNSSTPLVDSDGCPIEKLEPSKVHIEKSNFRQRIKPYTIVIVITFISIAYGYYKYRKYYALDPLWSFSFNVSLYGQQGKQNRNTPKAEIISFELNPEKTSLIDTGNRYYQLPPLNNLITDAEVSELRISFQNIIRRKNLSGYIQYTLTDNQVRQLHTRNNSEAQRFRNGVVPRDSIQWSDLRTNNSQDYQTVLQWMREHVGIQYPVFRFTVHNPTSNDIILTKVRYYIKSQPTLGDENSSAVIPYEFTYYHKISLRNDRNVDTVITKEIAPNARIMAGQTKGYEIAFGLDPRTNSKKIMATMRLEFITHDDKLKISTPTFNIELYPMP